MNIFRARRADRLYPRIAYRRTGVCFAPQLAPPVHADAKQLAPLEAVRRAHSRRVQAASAQHQRRRDHRAGSVQRHKLIGNERRHRCFAVRFQYHSCATQLFYIGHNEPGAVSVLVNTFWGHYLREDVPGGQTLDEEALGDLASPTSLNDLLLAPLGDLKGKLVGASRLRR